MLIYNYSKIKKDNSYHTAKRTIYSLMVVAFSCVQSLAQQSEGQRLVVGKVISAVDHSKGLMVDVAIEGVTITAKRTGTYAVSDKEGRFQIVAFANDALVFSSMGYQTLEEAIKGRTQIEVTMVPDENVLQEVEINAGYYSINKRFSTGNIGRVDAEIITRQPVGNPLLALQGRVPGLEITQSSGVPGRQVNVLIRGQNSIANGNEPLYIVDGVPWLSNSLSQVANAATIGFQSPFNSINPADIESIEVLKDADATAIYGSRGANGVILITTKRGYSGKLKVELNAYSGTGKVANTMQLMNTEQYLAMRQEALSNAGLSPTNANAPDLLLYDSQRYTDWKKAFLGNNAAISDGQLALVGGSQAIQMRFSVGYRNESTIFFKDLFNERVSAKLSVSYRSPDNRFRFESATNYSTDANQLPSTDLTRWIYSAPNMMVYNEDGSLAWNENGSANRANPMAMTLSSFYGVSKNLISNVNANYTLFKGLSFRLNAGYSQMAHDEKRVAPKNSYIPNPNRISGDSQFGYRKYTNWIMEPQLNYQYDASYGKWDVLLGGSWQQNHIEGVSLAASNYSSDALLHSTTGAAVINVNNNYGLYRYQSIFGRINYQHSGKYLLNITGRRDGSSRFGPGKQYAGFGAVGIGWVFSEEHIVRNGMQFLSFGKIRGSYGLTGNDNIGNYQYLDTYGGISNPYGGISGLVPQRLYNPNYGWETNRKLEGALELGFLKDKVLISASWFRNRSSNQLLAYALPAQTGFSGITRNMPATVQNHGWELEVNASPIRSDLWEWTSNFNLTIARNNLLEFPDLASSSYASQYEEGHSLNIRKVYRYLGVNPQTGLYEVDIDGGLNTIVDLTPNYYGGWNNSIRYKNVQMDVFLQFVNKIAPNYLYTLTGMPGLIDINPPVATLRRWASPNDVSDIQMFAAGFAPASTARTNYRNSDGSYTDASFLRIKNISLSYQLPQQWLSKIWAEQCRIYLQGQNLITFTRYEGNDPEVTNMTNLPPLRMVTLGFQLTF